MSKRGEKSDMLTGIRPSAEAVQHQEQQSGLSRILLEVESLATVQAIVGGMDLIVNGLRRSADDFFYGNPEKLKKHKTQIAEKIREEVYDFLSGLNIGEERAKAVLNLYLSPSSDSERERSGKERFRSEEHTSELQSQ